MLESIIFLARLSFNLTISFIGFNNSFGIPISLNLAKSGVTKFIFFVTSSLPLKNSYMVFSIFCFVNSVCSTYSGFFKILSMSFSKPLNLPSASFKKDSTNGFIKVDSFAISILSNTGSTPSNSICFASI